MLLLIRLINSVDTKLHKSISYFPLHIVNITPYQKMFQKVHLITRRKLSQTIFVIGLRMKFY
jgi:hypothetical protein